MRYRVRQPEVEAFCYGIDHMPDWFIKCIEADWAIPGQFGVVLRKTFSQTEYVRAGSWIVKGYNNIPYSILDDDFEHMFEPCE